MGSKLLRWSVAWPAKFFSAGWLLGMEDCPGPGGTILPSTCSTLNFQSKLSPKGWRRHKAESSQFGVFFFYKTYIFENNESKVKPCYLNNSYNNGSQNSAKTHSRLNYHWWTVHGQEDVGLWVMQQALLSGHQDRQPPGQRFGLNLKKWPFWASFTSRTHRDTLGCQEFHGPEVASLAQAILCQMSSKIVDAVTQLCWAYSA